MKTIFNKLDDTLTYSANKWPGNIAIEDGKDELSYGALMSASRKISSVLHANNLSNNRRIGILLPKTVESVIAVFGILYSGNCYVPLDDDAPEERNGYIVSDCSLSALISLPHRLDEINIPQTDRISIQEFGLEITILEEKQNKPTTDNNPAYILYTSGSTGKPKGVMFSHENALSFIEWGRIKFEADSNSVFSSHAPFHFDLSVFDLFVSLSSGSKLILIDSKTGKNPRALSHLIQEKKITHWYSTPTILKLMLNYGKIERFNHASLKYILFAGEVFPIEPLRSLSKAWSGAKFFNLYGPTETNVCTYYEIPLPIANNQNKIYPIGKRLPQFDFLLSEVSEENNELCVSGVGLCLGYWNNEIKNQNSFFYLENTRWYRTGDLVELDKSGNLSYLGRIDRMVKKNGYRIELGEIENTLSLHPDICDGAVLAKKDENLEVSIHAFIHLTNSDKLNNILVREFLIKQLPLYMLPDSITFLDKIPKTSTDKTDYKTLEKLI